MKKKSFSVFFYKFPVRAMWGICVNSHDGCIYTCRALPLFDMPKKENIQVQSLDIDCS